MENSLHSSLYLPKFYIDIEKLHYIKISHKDFDQTNFDKKIVAKILAT